MTRHTVTFVPESGGFLVSCSQGCNLGTTAHAADEAAAASRIRLHELSTGTVHDHPEDGSRATIASGTPVADALAEVDRCTAELDRVRDLGEDEDAAGDSYVSAAVALTDAVRASLSAFSEGDVRTLAGTANYLNYEFDSGDLLSERQLEVLGRAYKLFCAGS